MKAARLPRLFVTPLHRPCLLHSQTRTITTRTIKEIRSAEEIFADYIPDNETVRLGVGRVYLAEGLQLYKAHVNKEVNVLLNAAPFRVRYMSDLRKLDDKTIMDLPLKDWLKEGLVKLARVQPTTKANAEPQKVKQLEVDKKQSSTELATASELTEEEIEAETHKAALEKARAIRKQKRKDSKKRKKRVDKTQLILSDHH